MTHKGPTASERNWDAGFLQTSNPLASTQLSSQHAHSQVASTEGGGEKKLLNVRHDNLVYPQTC